VSAAEGLVSLEERVDWISNTKVSKHLDCSAPSSCEYLRINDLPIGGRQLPVHLLARRRYIRWEDREVLSVPSEAHRIGSVVSAPALCNGEANSEHDRAWEREVMMVRVNEQQGAAGAALTDHDPPIVDIKVAIEVP